ncbi:MAG: MlaE family lipid ABC transporter permease subunit [Salinarimonas sp.]
MPAHARTDPAKKHEPRAALAGEGRLVLEGEWIAQHAATIAQSLNAVRSQAAGTGTIAFDFSNVTRFDTMGALVLSQFRGELEGLGAKVSITGERDEQATLLREVARRKIEPPKQVHRSRFVDMLEDVGHTIVESGRDVVKGVSFLGEVCAALVRVIIHPRRFRGTALVNQLEQIAFKGVPIITLISFLVGAIIAQQGIFQLQRFGATSFVVDLVGILVLRELGVLLTAIMVAGRSGSAFTAEIGSMKMREEIDAIRVMGLDPVEVLILPRLLALLIGLPLLTFIASMAALLGAMVVSWIYGGITPDVFLDRLREGIAMNTFFVGLIKAPFMALVIGVIACIEGMAVKGSAESLGRRVTSSVVKAIFMVIVMDGLFAMFFAAIDY